MGMDERNAGRILNEEEEAKRRATLRLSTMLSPWKADGTAIRKGIEDAAAIWPDPDDWRVLRRTTYGGSRPLGAADFEWVKESKGILEYLLEKRQGGLIKKVLQMGGSVIGQAPSQEGETKERAAARWMVKLTDRAGWAGGRPAASQETLKLLLENASMDKKRGVMFLLELAEACRPLAGQVWTKVEESAGAVEAEAIRRLKPLLSELQRRKAVPEDLEEARKAVERKWRSEEKLGDSDGEEVDQEKLPRSSAGRVEGLGLALRWDDPEMYGSLARMLGFLDGARNDLRMGSLESASGGKARKMSSRALAEGSWKVLALHLAAGVDPWMIAQDLGARMSEGNPVMLFAACAEKRSGQLGKDEGMRREMEACAAAWMEGVERGAERVSPGEGKEMALRKVREALERMGEGWVARGVLKAREEELAMRMGMGMGMGMEEGNGQQERPRGARRGL